MQEKKERKEKERIRKWKKERERKRLEIKREETVTYHIVRLEDFLDADVDKVVV